MRGGWFRIATLAAVGLWCFALVLPAYKACFNYSIELPMPGPLMGWQIALFGWLGPMGIEGYVGDVPGREYPATCNALLPALDIGRFREISTAELSWFANLFWWRCAYLMLKGRSVPAFSAAAAALLALLALQPISMWFDHPIAGYTPVLGAYVWAITMAAPLALLPIARVIKSQPISQRSNANHDLPAPGNAAK